MSHDLTDWYSPAPSKRFDKRVIKFAANFEARRSTVFIDATEWGEVLALSGAPYLLGAEPEDGSLESNDRCGQSIVFGFVQRLHAKAVNESPPSARKLSVATR